MFENFELHYFTRSKNNTAFFDDLNDSPFADKVFFHFNDENDDKDSVVKQALSQEGALNKDSHLLFINVQIGSRRSIEPR